MGSSNHNGRALPARFVLSAPTSSDTCLRGGEQVQTPEPNADEAIKEIATLLARAYERRASLRLVHSPPRQEIASTEELANSAEKSVHGLTLTPRRKD